MTAPADSRWFAVIAGEEMGPFSDAELRVLASRGAIVPATKVRHFDMAEQHEARRVAGLFAGTVPAPITVQPRAAPIARAPALEASVRFQPRFGRAANDFALRGTGTLRIDASTIEVSGRRGDAGRGEPVTRRFERADIVEVARKGDRIEFAVRAQAAGGPDRRMVFFARNADVGHDIEAALPKRSVDGERQPLPPREAVRLVPRPPWVAPALIVAMLAMFLVIVRHGGGWFAMDGPVHVRFGSNLGELTARAEWWRLASAMLLSAGILHLALGAWALFDIGRAAERYFGSGRLLVVLLVSGIAGNLTSLVWNPATHVVGPSGALFGVLGALAASLPDAERKSFFLRHRLSIGAFVTGTLALAFLVAGIDVAMNLGGLAAGAAAGLAIAGPAGRAWSLPGTRAEHVVVALLLPTVLATIALPILHRARLVHHEHAFEQGVAALSREHRKLDAEMQILIESLRSGRYSMPQVLQGLEAQQQAWTTLNGRFARLPLEPRAHYADLHGQLQHYTSLRARAAQSLAVSLRTRDEIRAREGAALHASAKQLEPGFERRISR